MATFFLLIIYITFIGLGLPDSMLGAAWPVMHLDLGTGIGSMGVITMVIAGGTVVSSLFSERVIRRFGTGKITLISVLLTALALLGYALAPGFLWLVLLAVPLGVGAGAVDAGLNNYVALHYKPHHMSWLHCFWGIGAFTGPLVMSGFLYDGNWRGSYLTVAIIQFGIVLLLLFTLPLWKKPGAQAEESDSADVPPSPKGSPLRLRGVLPALGVFVCYSAIEMSVNSWGASYLVQIRRLDAPLAAQYISLFFVGITVGRLLTGFLTLRLNNRSLIRLGQCIVAMGALLLLLPASRCLALAGMIVIGLGCAPVFPCMLHETPRRFGAQWSQQIMGLQMASAYLASTFLPPLLGIAASRFSFGFFPVFLLVCAALMLALAERLNRAGNTNKEGFH